MGMNCKAKYWKIALMVLVGIAAMGAVVMLLWNWLMPSLFSGTARIDYLQAMGLLVLSKILFGGFRGRGCHGHWRHRHCRAMVPEEAGSSEGGMRECCSGSHTKTVEGKK